MNAWVYAAQSRTAEADEFADRLRRENNYGVIQANARYYQGEIHTDAVAVYHDGSEPRIPDAHEGSDVRVERWDQRTAEASETPTVAARSDGHTVEQNGTWFTLYDPDGNKVGVSKRSEDDAWAQLGGVD